LHLQISVKSLNIRRLGVCYVFDRVSTETGVRGDFAGHLAEVDKIFFDQANFSIQNVDGLAANTLAARTLTLNGTMGKVFDLLDKALIGRIINGLDSKFPGIFRDLNTVVLSIPVPLRIKKQPKSRILGMNIGWRRRSDGRRFSLLLVGPQAAPRKPTQGGRQPTPVRQLRNTIAHEIGHSLGLKHHPSEERDLPPVLIGKDINPEFFKPNFHNLMFPTTLIVSDRLNGAQVEVVHQGNPHFREVDF